jgi:hypothetical protein
MSLLKDAEQLMHTVWNRWTTTSDPVEILETPPGVGSRDGKFGDWLRLNEGNEVGAVLDDSAKVLSESAGVESLESLL